MLFVTIFGELWQNHVSGSVEPPRDSIRPPGIAAGSLTWANDLHASKISTEVRAPTALDEDVAN